MKTNPAVVIISLGLCSCSVVKQSFEYLLTTISPGESAHRQIHCVSQVREFEQLGLKQYDYMLNGEMNLVACLKWMPNNNPTSPRAHTVPMTVAERVGEMDKASRKHYLADCGCLDDKHVWGR